MSGSTSDHAVSAMLRAWVTDSLLQLEMVMVLLVVSVVPEQLR